MGNRGESIVISSLISHLKQANEVLSKSPLVLMPRIDGDESITRSAADLNLFASSDDTLASLSAYLHTPVYAKHPPSHSKPHTRDLVLLGSTLLIPLASWISDPSSPSPFDSTPLLTITIVETDICELVSLLLCVDLEPLVESMRKVGIGFHLIYEPVPEYAREKVFDYLYVHNPFALYSLRVCKSPTNTSRNIRLNRFFFDQSEIAQRFLGSIGSTQDELVQIWQSLYNTLKSDAPFLCQTTDTCDPPRERKAVIVGSGPSLDDNLEYLSAAQDNAYIICACSSLRTLLANGIVPNAVVVLERSDLIYTYLSEVRDENFPGFSDVILISAVTSDPRILDLFNTRYLFNRRFSSTFALSHQQPAGSALLHGGPESLNACIDICHLLDLSSLVLVGCDFGSIKKITSVQKMLLELTLGI